MGETVWNDIRKKLMSKWLLGYSGRGTIATRSGVKSVSNAVEMVLAVDISLLDGQEPSRSQDLWRT